MFGQKYKLNPETLRIEEARLPLKKRVITGLIAGVLILTAAFGMRILYDYNAKSPRLVYYEKKNELLRNEYQQLNSELKEDESRLAELRRKDDKMYRSIFGMEPIPSSIREAGTGGAVRHPSLQSISNPDLVIDVFDKLDMVLTKARIQSSSFEDLEAAAVNNQHLLANKPHIQPISPADKYWLTSDFGYRSDPFTRIKRFHHGIDMAGSLGLKIYATGDGVVEIAGEIKGSGYGREVLLDHDFGYKSRYAHLQEVLVEHGQKVKRGQVIGTLGSSGRSTGPHLHYEVHYNNKVINPMFFFYEELSSEEFEIIARRALGE